MGEDLKREIARLRHGDELRVTTIADVAVSMRELFAALELIHSQGAVVIDAKGRRSDKDVIAMLQDASTKLRKGAATRVARRSGSKGGRKPIKDEDRSPGIARAREVWRDLHIPTNPEAIEQLRKECVPPSPPWTYYALLKRWGNSGRVQVGRPRKDGVRKVSRKRRRT